MLVDPISAQIETPHDQIYQGYISGKGLGGLTYEKIDKPVEDFIKNLNYDDRIEFMDHGNEDIRVYESYIAEDDKIYILGDAEVQKNVNSNIGHENLIVKNGRSKAMYIGDSHERKIADKIRYSLIKDIIGGLLTSVIFLLILLLIFNV